MEPGEDKKAINLTQLGKNSRARKDKKLGTKRGRKAGVDETIVIATPDSIVINNILNDDDLAFTPEPEASCMSQSTTKTKKQRCTELQSNLCDTPMQPSKTTRTPKLVIVSPQRNPNYT